MKMSPRPDDTSIVHLPVGFFHYLLTQAEKWKNCLTSSLSRRPINPEKFDTSIVSWGFLKMLA